MKFIQLLKILRAHLGLILFSVSGACLLATFVTATTSPKYLATSSVLINVADTPVNSTIPAPSQPHSSYLATQIDLITSQSVALKVVDRLHLVDDEQASRRFLGTESFFQEQPFQEQLERIKTGWQSLVEKIAPQPKDADPEQGAPDPNRDRFRLADRLLKRTSVRPSPESNVLQIGFVAPSARAAAEGAAAIVDGYIETALELNVNPARASSEWLDSQVQRLTADVEHARADLSKFQQRAGIVGVNGDDSDETARLNDLNSQLVAAESQNHPAILALKSDLARAQAKLNDLPPQLGPNHPTYQRVQNEAAVLRVHLEQESEQIAANLRREIAAQKESMLRMKQQHAQLAALKDTVDSAQRALDDATLKATQARMSSQVTQTNISVVRVAVPPRKPTAPNPVINLLVGGVVGIALGIGLALWREVVCRFVRNADDLRDFLGVQVLGVLHDGPRSLSGRARLSNNHAPLLSVNR
jgi:uncharacterized protein involved in exopolysaccharide biosynthesis